MIGHIMFGLAVFLFLLMIPMLFYMFWMYYEDFIKDDKNRD